MPDLDRDALQSRLSDIIGDPNNTRWTTTQKQNMLQVAQEAFVNDSKCLIDNQQFSITDGDNTYALAADTFDVRRVAHKGLPLTRISKFDLDVYVGGDWTDDTGTPTRYYVDLTGTSKELTLYPKPTANDVGTNNLVVEYVAIPAVMSSGAADPLDAQVLLQPYLMAIVYYAAAEFLNMSKDPQEWARANIYRAQYKGIASDCEEIYNALRETKPPRMRGGRYFRGY